MDAYTFWDGLLQYAIGVFTLMYHVPVWLGVFHQTMAMVLFGVALAARHSVKKRAKHST